MTTLSPFVRKTVALGLLILAMLFVALFAVKPVFGWASQHIEAMRDARFELLRAERRARATAGTSDSLADELERTTSVRLLPGQTQSEGAAALQALIEEKSRLASITLESLQATQATQGVPLVQVGYEVRATGTERALVNAIQSLEAGTPTIRIERIAIRALEAAPEQTENIRVAVDLTLIGFWSVPPTLAETKK